MILVRLGFGLRVRLGLGVYKVKVGFKCRVWVGFSGKVRIGFRGKVRVGFKGKVGVRFRGIVRFRFGSKVRIRCRGKVLFTLVLFSGREKSQKYDLKDLDLTGIVICTCGALSYSFDQRIGLANLYFLLQTSSFELLSTISTPF